MNIEDLAEKLSKIWHDWANPKDNNKTAYIKMAEYVKAIELEAKMNEVVKYLHDDTTMWRCRKRIAELQSQLKELEGK